MARRGDYVVVVEGLADPKEIQRLKPAIRKSAYRAINSGADFGRAESVRKMRREVNFPSGYLNGQDARLNVTRRASFDSLEAVISGRRQPTSLARFVVGATKPKSGVNVSITPGSTNLLKRAFIIKLKTNNLGLAVRTERGGKPTNAYKPKELGDGLWLLYGPSVDQVFQSVREDVSPTINDHVRREFERLMEVEIA
jgi:hypothetical protein